MTGVQTCALPIWTTAGATKLDVRGTSNSAASTIQVVGNSVSTLLLGQNADGGVIRGQGGNNALTFWTGGLGDTGAGQSGSERARIDSSGNFLLNTTYPDGKFVIAQSGAAWAQSVQHTNSGTQYFIQFVYSGSEIGTIKGSNTSTAYATSSDYRLKDNITPMTGALSKVAALKPVTYKWKVDGSDGEGFIAHELAERSEEHTS